MEEYTVYTVYIYVTRYRLALMSFFDNPLLVWSVNRILGENIQTPTIVLPY